MVSASSSAPSVMMISAFADLPAFFRVSVPSVTASDRLEPLMWAEFISI